MAVAKNKAQQPAAARAVRQGGRQQGQQDGQAPRSGRRSRQGPGTRRLPRHAADPPLRGEGRPDVRHGPDRRLLPPLHRPGGRGGRHADGAQRGRRHHHRLPRPRPHAGRRHGRQGRDGGADRPRPRLFQGQGRLDAHVLRREGLLRRPWHRRGAGAARNGPRLCQQIPRQGQCLADLFRRRRGQPGPGLRKLQHGEALDAAGDLHHREQPIRHGHLAQARVGDHRPLSSRRGPRHSRPAGRRHGRARREGRRRQGRRNGAAKATARSFWR